jgi:O-antigen ligase
VLVFLNLNLLKEYKKYFLIILVFAVVNCFFSTSQPVSVYRWLKVFEIAFVAIYFAKQRVLKFTPIITTFFVSSVFVSLIGISQFIKGGTIGGPLYYLGERSFNQGTPGIALVSLSGVEHMRAYSIFSHPNSLAGYLGAVILFMLLSGKLKKNIFNIIGVLLILICFVLTFSISAYIGVFFVFSYYLFSRNQKSFKGVVISSFLLFVIGSLFLPLVAPWIIKTFPLVGQNVYQRLDLAFIAGQVINSNFLIGEGLGAFISNIPTYKGIFSYSWLLQPVHNIFLLVFAETGIIGLLAFCYVIFKVLINQLRDKRIYILLPFLLILFTGLFDHYTLSLQQNMLLFGVFVGLSFNDTGL